MLKVGLTGGIGAGKSEVSRLLASYGAIIVDADLAAREVVAAGTPGLAAVVEEFGPEVRRPDGELDRERVAAIVFADADALARLNAIVHPLVGVRMREMAEAAGEDDVIVYDVPLLTENHLAGAYDVVLVVDAPEETQVARLIESRGMSEADARARIAAQATRADRLAIADIVIDNSGSREDLAARVAEVWADLSSRSPSTQ